ncbi:MAG: hypothetical protein ABSA86_08275 [Oryzomonas sp.]
MVHAEYKYVTLKGSLLIAVEWFAISHRFQNKLRKEMTAHYCWLFAQMPVQYSSSSLGTFMINNNRIITGKTIEAEYHESEDPMNRHNCYVEALPRIYLDDECKQWDAALAQNDGLPQEDPWNEKPNDRNLRQEIYDTWSKLPKHNQAWLEVRGIVPFESILDIDELGDEIVDAPHIFVPFKGVDGPFVNFTAVVECVDSYSGRTLTPLSKDDKRISKFKKEWRDAPEK